MAGVTTRPVRPVVPEVGQTVYLDGSASPQFKARPVRLLLTEPPAPSSLDHNAGRPVERAEWWHLTGWELGPRNQRVELRGPLMALAEGVVVYAGAAAVTAPKRTRPRPT